MSAQPQLFKIKVNSENQDSKKIVSDGNIEETEFTRLELLEKHIEEWVETNPGILGDDLLIISKQFKGFDKTKEKLDLLAVDQEGRLVVIELKRDDSGSDVHWQAIKYASYLSQANQGDIVSMLSKYEDVSGEEAKQKLRDHIEADNLDILNNDQRIILASHRFARQVTSAALWLNEKSPSKNLITCVQIVPYLDESKTGSLFLQANTIIPVPGTEAYTIGVGSLENGDDESSHRNDEVTHFLREVACLTTSGLSSEIRRPDRKNHHSPGGRRHRYYRIWYSRPPWGSKRMRYYISLFGDGSMGSAWRAEVGVQYNRGPLSKLGYSEDDFRNLEDTILNLEAHPNQTNFSGSWKRSISAKFSNGQPLGDAFAKDLSDTLRTFMEAITPAVDEFEEERSIQEDD